MKHRILSLSIIAILVVAAGHIVYTSLYEEVMLSNLTMDNIEALATGETQGCPGSDSKPNGAGCWCNGWFASWRSK